MAIRKALPADVDSLLTLLEQLFSIEQDFEFSEDRQRAGIKLMLESNRSVILVFEENERILGMVSGQVLISTAEGKPALLVEDLVIIEEHRGRGIGGELLAAAGIWGRERGACRMQLLADCKNSKGLEFYRKNAWNRTNLICLRKYCGD